MSTQNSLNTFIFRIPYPSLFMQILARKQLRNFVRIILLLFSCTHLPHFTGKAQPTIAENSANGLFLQADGTLYAYGTSELGRLGYVLSNSIITYPPDLPRQVGQSRDWVSIANSYANGYAIKRDGSLWGWGYNGDYQITDQAETVIAPPVKIGRDSDWMQIAAGIGHVLALKKDGSLWAWGQNLYGQVGIGKTGESTILRPVLIGTGYRDISAGDIHSLAIKADGSLWAWGNNQYGQLGDGGLTDSYVPKLIGNGFAKLSASMLGSAALKTDGTLWQWGFGPSYLSAVTPPQLVKGKQIYLQPIQVGTESFTSLSISASYGFGLKSDGTAWAWGRNVCESSTNTVNIPIGTSPKLFAEGLEEVVAGNYYILATEKGGKKKVWSCYSNRPTISYVSFSPAKVNISSTIEGNVYSLKLMGVIEPFYSDIDKNILIYLALILPDGKVWFSSNGNLVPWNGGGLPIYAKATAKARMEIPIISTKTDLSKIAGSKIILGYGQSELQMLDLKQYEILYTVPDNSN